MDRIVDGEHYILRYLYLSFWAAFIKLIIFYQIQLQFLSSVDIFFEFLALKSISIFWKYPTHVINKAHPVESISSYFFPFNS